MATVKQIVINNIAEGYSAPVFCRLRLIKDNRTVTTTGKAGTDTTEYVITFNTDKTLTVKLSSANTTYPIQHIWTLYPTVVQCCGFAEDDNNKSITLTFSEAQDTSIFDWIEISPYSPDGSLSARSLSWIVYSDDGVIKVGEGTWTRNKNIEYDIIKIFHPDYVKTDTDADPKAVKWIGFKLNELGNLTYGVLSGFQIYKNGTAGVNTATYLGVNTATFSIAIGDETITGRVWTSSQYSTTYTPNKIFTGIFYWTAANAANSWVYIEFDTPTTFDYITIYPNNKAVTYWNRSTSCFLYNKDGEEILLDIHNYNDIPISVNNLIWSIYHPSYIKQPTYTIEIEASDANYGANLVRFQAYKKDGTLLTITPTRVNALNCTLKIAEYPDVTLNATASSNWANYYLDSFFKTTYFFGASGKVLTVQIKDIPLEIISELDYIKFGSNYNTSYFNDYNIVRVYDNEGVILSEAKWTKPDVFTPDVSKDETYPIKLVQPSYYLLDGEGNRWIYGSTGTLVKDETNSQVFYKLKGLSKELLDKNSLTNVKLYSDMPTLSRVANNPQAKISKVVATKGIPLSKFEKLDSIKVFSEIEENYSELYMSFNIGGVEYGQYYTQIIIPVDTTDLVEYAYIKNNCVNLLNNTYITDFITEFNNTFPTMIVDKSTEIIFTFYIYSYSSLDYKINLNRIDISYSSSENNYQYNNTSASKAIFLESRIFLPSGTLAANSKNKVVYYEMADDTNKPAVTKKPIKKLMIQCNSISYATLSAIAFKGYTVTEATYKDGVFGHIDFKIQPNGTQEFIECTFDYPNYNTASATYANQFEIFSDLPAKTHDYAYSPAAPNNYLTVYIEFGKAIDLESIYFATYRINSVSYNYTITKFDENLSVIDTRLYDEGYITSSAETNEFYLWDYQ